MYWPLQRTIYCKIQSQFSKKLKNSTNFLNFLEGEWVNLWLRKNVELQLCSNFLESKTWNICFSFPVITRRWNFKFHAQEICLVFSSRSILDKITTNSQNVTLFFQLGTNHCSKLCNNLYQMHDVQCKKMFIWKFGFAPPVHMVHPGEGGFFP